MFLWKATIKAEVTTLLEVEAETEQEAREKAARGEGDVLWIEEEDWDEFNVEEVEKTWPPKEEA
jgi:hypothetical protein